MRRRASTPWVVPAAFVVGAITWLLFTSFGVKVSPFLPFILGFLGSFLVGCLSIAASTIGTRRSHQANSVIEDLIEFRPDLAYGRLRVREDSNRSSTQLDALLTSRDRIFLQIVAGQRDTDQRLDLDE